MKFFKNNQARKYPQSRPKNTLLSFCRMSPTTLYKKNIHKILHIFEKTIFILNSTNFVVFELARHDDIRVFLLQESKYFGCWG